MKDNGGPAFPYKDGQDRNPDGTWQGPWIPGMTVRQLYKIAAMIAKGNEHGQAKDAAAECGRYADAMIAEDREAAKEDPK